MNTDMPNEENKLSEKESLDLIASMISKAKNSYHETGIGPILWGSVISFCSLVTYCQIRFQFNLPFDIWILTLVAIVPQILIVAKEKKLNKVRTYDDTVMDYVWTCFGISIFLLIFINANLIYQLNLLFEDYYKSTGKHPAFNYNNFATSFFLLLYGIPTIITGGYRKFKPMLIGGIICWVCAVVSIYTPVEWDMLLTAFAAISAWLIPGIILWKDYKKRKTGNV